MLAFKNNCAANLDKHWLHDKKLTDINGYTVAMLSLAYQSYGNLIQYWWHENDVRNHDGETVAHLAAMFG